VPGTLPNLCEAKTIVCQGCLLPQEWLRQVPGTFDNYAELGYILGGRTRITVAVVVRDRFQICEGANDGLDPGALL